jgi:hypothetical protein
LNTFTSSLNGAVEVTGSNLTVKGDLLVKGTTTTINSTTLTIGDNIIQLNGSGASNAGLVVQDATGASIVSGSLLWDTATDYWKAGKLGSEDRIILATEFTNLSSSILSRAASLESASGSIRSDFNSFTSSNNAIETTQDGRLTSIEGKTGSISLLNTYTGSNNTVIGTLQTATSSINTFTASVSSVTNSLQLTTASLNTFTSSASSKLTAIESTTGSINTFTSSASGRLTSLESASSSIRTDFNTFTSSASGRLTSIEGKTGSYATTGSNIFKADQVVTGSITTTGNVTAGVNLISANSVGDEGGEILLYKSQTNNSLTGSGITIDSYQNKLRIFEQGGNARGAYLDITTLGVGVSTNLNVSANITAIESTTGSLNTFTSSASGRLTAIESTTASLNTYTSSNNTIIGTLQTTTSSLNTFTSSASGRLTSLESASSSIRTDFNSFTSSNNAIETTQNGRLTSIETSTGSLNSYTSSNNTTIGTLQTATSSLNTFTSSASGRLTSIEGKTGSYATTGSNVFVGNQTVSGSLIVTQNLTVYGSSSITYVTSSQLRIDDNIITVNTSSPGSRFGGLEVYDSGSVIQATGSILWDSVNNRWIYQQSSEATYGGGVLMSGPRSSGSLGSELTLTSGRVAKSAGGDHLNDSNITDNGTTVSINSNTEITGSLIVTNTIVSQTTPLVSGSSQISYTGITNVPSGIVSGSSQVLNGSGVWSGSAQLPSGVISGSAQLPSGTVSGSVQVDITSTTNYTTFSSSIATTDSNQNTRLGLLETSTGSLNTFTSSASGRLTSLESASSSIRSDFNSFTSSNNAIETTQNGRLTSLESASSSIRSDFNSFTSSNNAVETTQNGRLTSIEGVTGSISLLNTYTGSNNTVIGTLQTATSSLNTYTSSLNTIIGTLQTSTSSINTFTASVSSVTYSLQLTTASLNSYTSSNNTVIGTLQTATSSLNTYTSSNTTNINAIHTATSSLNTFTSSFNTAIGLSGADVTIKGNLTISGTTTTINSTTVAIGDNIIQLNGTGATNAGLVVRDATASSLTSGSLLWDTTNDKWIAGQLGSEDDVVLRTTSQTLTNKTISGGSNTLSNIANSSLTNSTISIAGNSIALGGTITAATILSGTGTVSGSGQIPALLPSGTVSGSIQVALTGTSGFGTYLNQAVLTTSSPTFNTVNATTLTDGYITYSVAQINRSAGYVELQYTSLGGVKMFGGGATPITFATNGSITSGTWAGTAIAVANGGTGATDAATARTNLGLAIGTNVLAYRTFGTAANSNTGDFAAYNATTYVGTTAIALNRTSASQTLTGVSIDGSSASTTGNAATATNLSNSGTVTLASATESNSITITQPSYTSYTPVKLLNFDWYGNTWSIGNIRSTGTPSSGLGIFLSSVEKFRFMDGSMTITGSTVLHSGNYSTYASPLAGSSSITTVGSITSGTWNGSTISIANGGTSSTTASSARANLGLAIGTDVLAYRTFGTAANNNTGDFAAYNATTYVGTTAIALNRSSASQTLSGVSIDGTANNATNIGGRAFSNTGDNSGVNADTLASNGISYASSNVSLLGQTDGALYSQAYSAAWQHQIYGDYRTGQLVVRGKNSGTWQSWRTIIDSTTIGSQSVNYATTAGSAPNGTNVNNYYSTTAGNGYGFRFWGGSDAYKISMGNSSLYQYGTVTDYSLKMQMNDSDAGRGFTWGRESYAPIASLNATSGNMQIAGSFTLGGILTENSSIRYKKDIETIKYGLDKVLQMRGVTYVKKDTGLSEVGVIAEEMNEVDPLLVIKNEEGEVDSVTYSRINAYLIEAVKELKQELNEQNLIITELKRKLGL